MKILRLCQPALTCLFTCMLISSGAHADPTWGVGVSFVPGYGFALGVRVFSDDEERTTYASVGLDYLIKVKSDRGFRPVIGVGYQYTSMFDEVNLGYRGGRFDWGLSTGYVDNRAPFRRPAGQPACYPNCIVWPE